jgi:hypothetical protein
LTNNTLCGKVIVSSLRGEREEKTSNEEQLS